MPKSKRKKRSKSKSGYIGVSKETSGRYTARICINRKHKYLGSSYDTAKQAAKAYDKEAIKLGRPFAKLNYPKKAPVGYTPIQKALYSNKAVGYRGVSKHGKKFMAQISIGGKRSYIGTYDTPKEAAIAFDRAALKANTIHRAEAILRCCTHDPSCGNAHWCSFPDKKLVQCLPGCFISERVNKQLWEIPEEHHGATK